MPKRKYIVSLKDGRRIPIEAHNSDEAKSIAKRYLTKPGSGGKKSAQVVGVTTPPSKRGQQHHSFFGGFGSRENPANYTHFGKRNKGGTV